MMLSNIYQGCVSIWDELETFVRQLSYFLMIYYNATNGIKTKNVDSRCNLKVNFVTEI
jgi:hypothetical protein